MLLFRFTQFFDDIVQPVADSRIAQSHFSGHFFEAATTADKIEDKILFFSAQAGKSRQRKIAAHCRFAFRALKFFYPECR